MAVNGSVTKLDRFVNVRSIYEADCSFNCIGSVISWLGPWNEDRKSSRVPSIDLLSSVHQVGDWALKSPRIILNKV